MRRRLIALFAATAACAGTSRPPDVAPIAAGPNVRALDARRITSADPARSARLFAALVGGQVSTDGQACVVRIAPDAPALRIEPGVERIAEPPGLEFTVIDLDAALVELAARRIAFELVDDATGRSARFVDADGRTVMLRTP